MSLTCPNADCPFLRTHGFAPSYRAGATTCSDCAAPLIEHNDTGGTTTATIPGVPPRMVTSTHGLASPLIITALVVAGVWALGFVPLPLVDAEHLRAWLAGGGTAMSPGALRSVSLVAIGIAPWISSALLVEIGAALVPRFRALRAPAGRQKLAAAADRLGVVVAVAQALMLVRWLEGLEAFGGPVLSDDGVGTHAALVASMVAGAVLCRLGVRLIDARGVAGGMTLLVAAALGAELIARLASLAASLRSGALAASDLLPWLLVIGGAVGAALLVRPFFDDDRPPQPVAGILPLLWGSAVLQVVASLVPLFNVEPFSWGVHQAVLAAWSVVLTIGIGRAMHLRAPGFAQALPMSLLFVGALLALWAFAGWRNVAIDATAVVIIVCVARDLIGEVALRREAGVLALALTASSLAEAQALQGRLAAAGIAAHVRAAHHRALLHFFGPHLALDVLVPIDDVERAREMATDEGVSESSA